MTSTITFILQRRLIFGEIRRRIGKQLYREAVACYGNCDISLESPCIGKFKRNTPKSLLKQHHNGYSFTPHRNWTSTKVLEKQKKIYIEDNQEDQNDFQDDKLLGDQKYSEVFKDQYLLPGGGHRIFAIQPDIKWGAKSSKLTTADLKLAEACALIETLPQWEVVDAAIYSLKYVDLKTVYGKGNFETIKQLVKRAKNEIGVTAVFIGIDMLNSIQLASLQHAMKVPVYDRFTIVLQIFQIHARTREAKLQVALAEIPYYRSRLRGMHDGSLDQQKGGMSHVGGSGETFLEMRNRLLHDREIKLKKELDKVKKQRQLLRKERGNKKFPVVAVVGYTNSGKTSLVKALTGEQSLVPKDQLFATLDVTAHAGVLPNKMTALFMDTVGFISDIPTSLVESFSATLEDILNADVILHVRDISHPDTEAQRVQVLKTLEELQLPDRLQENIIEVCNKCDLIDSEKELLLGEQSVVISATKGTGLTLLGNLMQDLIIDTTGRLRKRLKIPMNGPYLSWLYKEATVAGTHSIDGAPDHLFVDAIMTEAAYGKFQAQFGKMKKKPRPS